ncbi:hypothetical protein [Allopontixanthobacter sediminis]|uniref:SCP-2 sterol transfer family protein n=1 Tax=Allopontixanthobacter sediminis TaxID=1689985 RepID=A0A845AY35_9SPHN|nr:hypothetical protein [Allopontixanthobacter sediminis]MXP42836.1 hypothetical protein [Allopontixanthobacter sediminis]
MTSREALTSACEAIRTEFLPAYIRLLDAIEGLSVECVVGDERFRVSGSGELVIGEIGVISPSAHVLCTRTAILALVDGDMSLLDAVKRGKLDICGDTKELLSLARAQRAFAEGAARVRQVEDILAQYRIGASEAS